MIVQTPDDNQRQRPVDTPRVIYSGRPLYPFGDAVYDLFTYLEPGLVLDVGAAAGGVCRRIVQRSPESQIAAFEPFPGNWQLLDEAVGDLAQVAVDHRAASDTAGPARLYVSAVVAGNEKGWESKAGYSSAGTLVDQADDRFERSIDVETVRLDSLYSERVRLLKIDVQGAELAVLRGAQGLIDQDLIDFMWVEFTGELDILDFVRAAGFAVFDSHYLLIPRTDPPSPDDWFIVDTKNLSNGKVAYVAWPHEYPRSDAEYCTWLQAQKAKFIIQTDLTFVRRGFVPTFLAAAAAALGPSTAN